jgi:hypothetical protein
MMKVKKQRSIRPAVDGLEHKVLLSTGVAPHLAEHAQTAAAVAHVAIQKVKLMGYIYTGTGTVSPLGGVHATLNLPQKIVKLSNAGGTLKVKLTQVHKYGPTVTARAYKIMQGSGVFRSYRGQGHTSLTAVKVGGRLSVWTESFYP